MSVAYVVSSLPERRIPINDLSAVCQVNSLSVFIGHNKSSLYRPRSKASPSSSLRLLLASPSLPSLPGSSIPIDLDFEGSLMADNLVSPYNRRKFLLCTVVISQRLLVDSMRSCRTGDNNRRAP